MHIENLCAKTVIDVESITMNKMGEIANLMKAGFSKPMKGDRQWSCNEQTKKPHQKHESWLFCVSLGKPLSLSEPEYLSIWDIT